MKAVSSEVEKNSHKNLDASFLLTRSEGNVQEWVQNIYADHLWNINLVKCDVICVKNHISKNDAQISEFIKIIKWACLMVYFGY